MIDGKKKGVVQSPTLCRAFTSVYLGYVQLSYIYIDICVCLSKKDELENMKINMSLEYLNDLSVTDWQLVTCQLVIWQLVIYQLVIYQLVTNDLSVSGLLVGDLFANDVSVSAK